MVGSMATKTKSAANPEMTAEEIAAVKEGVADFAAGRVLSEEQFDEEMHRYFERREAQDGRQRTRG
jgi:predicted transcriptional regulator